MLGRNQNRRKESNKGVVMLHFRSDTLEEGHYMDRKINIHEQTMKKQCRVLYVMVCRWMWVSWKGKKCCVAILFSPERLNVVLLTSRKSLRDERMQKMSLVMLNIVPQFATQQLTTRIQFLLLCIRGAGRANFHSSSFDVLKNSWIFLAKSNKQQVRILYSSTEWMAYIYMYLYATCS